MCKEDRIIVVGASRGESLNISCKVEADPPVRNFRWKFNNSGETLEVSPRRFTIPSPGEPDGVSVLKYTPATELDYGTLSCWANNEIGTQSRPCLFQIVAAGELYFILSKYKQFSKYTASRKKVQKKKRIRQNDSWRSRETALKDILVTLCRWMLRGTSWRIIYASKKFVSREKIGSDAFSELPEARL